MSYQEEINSAFDEIRKQLAPIPRPQTPYNKLNYGSDRLGLNNFLLRKEVSFDIRFLEFSLEEYQNVLIKKTTSKEQKIAQNAVIKLKEAIVTILDNTKNEAEKNNAIFAFDKIARNSNLSQAQFILIGCVVGGLITTMLLVIGVPLGAGVIPVIAGIAIGGMMGNFAFEGDESKAGNKNILSDLKFFNKNTQANQQLPSSIFNDDEIEQHLRLLKIQR